MNISYCFLIDLVQRCLKPWSDPIMGQRALNTDLSLIITRINLIPNHQNNGL